MLQFSRSLLLIDDFENLFHLNRRFPYTIATVDRMEAVIRQLGGFRACYYKKQDLGPFLLLYAFFPFRKPEQET